MNFIKLVQIVNYILAKYDYRLNYMKLIKLLYIADRTCLDRWCYAISGDTYCSMKDGIVLETLYSHIKGRGEHQKEWNEVFFVDSYDLLSMDKNVTFGKLNRAEEKILNEVDATYHDKSEWYLVDKVIHNLPEWDKSVEQDNTSSPLDKRTILKYLGKSDADIDNIFETEESMAQLDEAFRRKGLLS